MFTPIHVLAHDYVLKKHFLALFLFFVPFCSRHTKFKYNFIVEAFNEIYRSTLTTTVGDEYKMFSSSLTSFSVVLCAKIFK